MTNITKDVYLCICYINLTNISCNYEQFNSFLEADKYYINKYNTNINHISTIISTKYIPGIFKKYYLNYKLSKLLLLFDETKKKILFF